MALTKCKECGKEVSTNADTCPHCGIKRPGIKAKEVVLGLVVLIGLVWVASLFFSGSDNAKASSTQAASVPVAAVSEKPSPSPAVVKPTIPARYYTIQDGLEYGYEQAVSAEAQHKGQIASKILMFRFLGERDGTLQFFTRSGDSVSVFQCERPCEFIKQMFFYDRELVKKEHIRAVEGSIAWGLTRDALNGHLKKYVKERDGKLQEIWFDESGPKWRALAKAKS